MISDFTRQTPRKAIVGQSVLFIKKCTSDCLKNDIKIYIKTAPTCFGAVTPSSGSALFVLAKVTVVKIVSYGTYVCV